MPVGMRRVLGYWGAHGYQERLRVLGCPQVQGELGVLVHLQVWGGFWGIGVLMGVGRNRGCWGAGRIGDTRVSVGVGKWGYKGVCGHRVSLGVLGCPQLWRWQWGCL